MLVSTMTSKEDATKNFIFDNAGHITEARYVRREKEKVLVYLSAAAGCVKACRFCHLTRTGQVDNYESTPAHIYEQASTVMDYYISRLDIDGPAKRVNFNFMARGEPLANKMFLNDFEEYRSKLLSLAKVMDLKPAINISTIMPMEVLTYGRGDPPSNPNFYDNRYPLKGLNHPEVYLYYSMYSTDQAFRNKWLPNAMPYDEALRLLRTFQNKQYPGHNVVTLHWPFIKSENDHRDDIRGVLQAVRDSKLRVKFNLVRYNAYSPVYGEESSEEVIQRNFEKLSNVFNNGSRIIPRVGYDVKASCGMFV